MSGTDHPPSTTSPTRVTRRVFTTTVAAFVAVAALVALIATTTGRSDAAAAEAHQPTTNADERAQLRSFQDDSATIARLATVAQAVAPPIPAAPTTTTTAPPAPAPQPVSSGSGYNDPNNPAAWDRLALCESGGNWAANTGNGYYGGIQFSLSSWQAAGGTGRPDLASRATQIAAGQRLWQQGGWVHWPACSRKLGYR